MRSGGVPDSFHIYGGTADFQVRIDGGRANGMILQQIVRQNLPFTEIALEYGSTHNPAWVHIALQPGRENEREIVRITNSGSSLKSYAWLQSNFA